VEKTKIIKALIKEHIKTQEEKKRKELSPFIKKMEKKKIFLKNKEIDLILYLKTMKTIMGKDFFFLVKDLEKLFYEIKKKEQKKGKNDKI